MEKASSSRPRNRKDNLVKTAFREIHSKLKEGSATEDQVREKRKKAYRLPTSSRLFRRISGVGRTSIDPGRTPNQGKSRVAPSARRLSIERAGLLLAMRVETILKPANETVVEHSERCQSGAAVPPPEATEKKWIKKAPLHNSAWEQKENGA